MLLRTLAGLGPVRAALALLGVLACAPVGGCARSQTERTAHPHVLLVTIDTLRADHLSAYGYERPTSPNLDRLAAAGALFEVAYAPTPATTPSHATLFTSRYPLGHGVLRNGIALGEELPTLPAMLAAQGYRTSAFVSSFPVSREFGLARGFSHFDDTFDGPQSTHPPPRDDHDGEGGFDRLGERTVDVALSWWAAQRDDAPRFVWVHLFDPHAPYGAPPPYGSTFQGDGRSPRQQRIDAYDGEILYADAQLGRLVGALARDAGGRGLLTIVTSDHGEAFGERGWQGHNRSVFEEEVRIPLVLHWPGVIAPGVRVSSVAHLVDLLPTVAAAAELDTGAGEFAGIDLLPVLEKPRGADAQRAVYLQRPYYEDARRARRRHMVGFGFGVRQGRWKYIEALEEGRRNLFDVVADPAEAIDLARDDADRATELSAALASWRERQAASAIAAPPRPRSRDVQRKLRALGYVE